MPDFDIDSALDPEEAERQAQAAWAAERDRREAARRAEIDAREARITARLARMEPALRRKTRAASWDAWTWPEQVPDYLVTHIRKGGVLNDLAEILDLIKRVHDLDGDNDSEVVEAMCDRRDFDMDDVETDFRDHNYEIVEDAESYARDYAENMGEIPAWLENYIDYKSMGEDFLRDEATVDLANGKILLFRD